MKIFTKLLVCLLLFFSVSLWANPMLPAFLEPTGTLSLPEYLKFPATNTEPDSMAVSVKPADSDVIVQDDWCGTGIGSIDLIPDPTIVCPCNYFWSNGQGTQDISGLTTGLYTVTIFDVNNDPSVAVAFVGAGFDLDATINGVVTGHTLCNGSGSGSIDLTVTGVFGSYDVAWSNGETIEDISNLDPDTYTVTVTVGVTCTNTAEFTVPNLTNAPIINWPAFGADYCETSTGTASVAPEGGVPPYTYLWSNGATDLMLADLPADDYTITVTGANGCTTSYTGTVSALTHNIDVSSYVVTDNTICNGSNGSISITVTTDAPWHLPATYLWSNGATTQNISALPSETYMVTVTLLGTCTDTEGFFVYHEPAFPDLSFAVTAGSCGLSNGAINLTPLPGGVPPYTYLWSNGATTQDLMDIPGGTYDVTLTSTTNGCSTTSSTIVDDNQAVFGYNAVVTDQTACDTLNGRIVLSLFPANLAFQWSNGATTKNLYPLAPGSYTVTISAGGTCTAVETYLVVDAAQYPQLPGLVDTSTCNLANGGINLMVTGSAVTPLTYLWSNGATTEDLAGILADTFSVVVTSAVGCTNQNTFIVPNFNDTIRVQGNVVDNFSCSFPTGTIELNVTPFDTLYTYLWSSGQTTDSLFNLPGGNYLVTVTLGGTCTALDTFAVINNALPPNLAASSTAASCSLNNGAADLNVTGGTAPFTYIWSNNATTEDLVSLPPGTYTVTVTGVNSCTAVNTVNVLNNGIALNINGVPLGNTSCLNANGSIDIAVNPPGTYSYDWSNSATTEDLNNLAPGSYTVTVSLGSCLSSNTYVVVDNALPPNLAAVGTAANCSLSDGAADLSVNGGTGPFTYLWSNAAITEDLNSVAPGTYTVTVTGANGCTAERSVNVLNNTIALNVNATPAGNTSCTTPNGALDIAVTPAGTYTYLWSNASATEDLNNLAAGNYTVTVTLGSCQSTGTFAVADNTITPILDAGITASVCSASDGAIDLTVSGAASPHTYIWSNLETTQDLSGILAGNYSVTVTAANGCTEVANINVPNNASTFSLAGAPAPLTNCATNNGSVDLNITPSNGTYTYAWSNMATTQDLNNLAPGTYTVSVTESGSCTATASFFVVDQRTNPITSQSIMPELCGLSNGSIDLTVTGGASPYIYLWDSGQAVEDLPNIPAGTYTVIVTDANNCTATASATIPGNSISFGLGGTSSANSSCILNNGAIDLTVNPAPPGYTYLWSGGGETTEDLSNLPAGTYTVTVSAGGNCTNTAVFNVTSNVPTPLLSQIITLATCGDSSGGIDLSVSGSPAPYQYIWSNAVTNEDLNAISAATYSVTVTAANGCTTVDNFVVPENVFVPGIASTLSPATSCVTNNGAIDLTITPAGTYTYLWSNGDITEDLVNVAAGNYIVTVSAGGACTNTANLTVNSNTGTVTLNGTPSSVLCFGGNNGAIDVTVNTGTAPFTYNWSPSIPGNPQDPSGLVSGTYTVTVTDNLGCTNTSVFTVIQPTAIQVQCAVTTPVSEPGFTDGAGSVDIAGGTGPYTVTWSPGGSQSAVLAGNFPITNLGEASYGVTVTDANGCPSTCGFSVGVATCATAVGTMSNSLLTLCGGGCLTATYNSNGQVLSSGDLLQFALHQGNGATIVNEIARSNQPTFCFDPATMSYGTTYYVSALAGGTDPSGNVVLGGFCTVNSPGTPIQFNEIPVASANLPSPLNCQNTQSTLQGNSSLNGSSYLWSTVNGTIVGNPAQATVTAAAAGTYTLVVTANGCSNTTTVTVTNISNQPQGNISASTTVLDCSIQSITLNGAVTGTANATTLQWLNNGIVLGSGNTLSVNGPGQYDFVVVDNVTFCSGTATITVTQNLNLPTLSVANPGQLTCTSPSQTLTGSSPTSGIQFAWATISGPDTTIVGNGATLSVNSPGTYYLFGENPANQCDNATSVVVIANQTPPTADAGTPFTLDCAGETAALDGSGTGAPNLGYQWSSVDGHFVSGANSASPLIDEAGTYSLVVTNPTNGCTATSDVTIQPEVPVAFASVIQPNCMELKGTVLVDSVTGLSDPILYSLNGSQPGAQSQFANITPGTYTVLVEGGNGCSATAVVTVEVPAVVQINLTAAADVDLGYSYQMDVQVNIDTADIASIIWTPAEGLDCPSCLNPLATPLTNTVYEVLVISDVGCEARAIVTLTVDKTRKIYGPNIFSPNDDGRNELFSIYGSPVAVQRIKSLRVYSRWGEAVYERNDFAPDDQNIGWDGTFKGQKLNPAVFVWQAVILFADGKEEVFTGDVTLQR
ncbi:MAG: gliding motility-associated C-terminal domain-containing protein [Saprospiraceae bacterium]